jgi:hypothetical protein
MPPWRSPSLYTMTWSTSALAATSGSPMRSSGSLYVHSVRSSSALISPLRCPCRFPWYFPQPCGGTGSPSAGGPQPSGSRSSGCWDKAPSLSAIWTRTVERVRAALRLQARLQIDHPARQPCKAITMTMRSSAPCPRVLPACALLGFRNAVAGLRDIGIGCVAVSPV